MLGRTPGNIVAVRPLRQAMEDILEDEDMSLENAVPVDYEDLMAEVEEAGERQMQLAQLLKNCPPSISLWMKNGFRNCGRPERLSRSACIRAV